ncbi:hypothetical protein Lal_00017407 [Lupinus albus]|nr:hypothetical protein Lal_00017407 [Lupinus albus]
MAYRLIHLLQGGVKQTDLTEYKSHLDHIDVNDFKWLPYETYINNLPREVQQDKQICHNHQRILMPFIELTNWVIKTQTGQPNMHSGLNIGVITRIKSYKYLKFNILFTHHNI